jgi:hypothetical protein
LTRKTFEVSHTLWMSFSFYSCRHVSILAPISPRLLTFFYRADWQVQFAEADLKTPLPRQFTFNDPEKIRELARRGEAWARFGNSADVGARD